MAGTFVAVVLVALVQMVSYQMYPPPPGFDFQDREALAQLTMQAPLGARLMVLLSYVAGTMGGAFVGAQFSVPEGPHRRGLFVAALILIAAIMNLNAIPYPLWFWVSNIVLIVVAGYLGAQLGSRRKVE